VRVKVMVFNATFNILAGSFIGEGNKRKTTDLPQVTDNLYLLMMYRVNSDDRH
jgi:hypothetical protein